MQSLFKGVSKRLKDETLEMEVSRLTRNVGWVDPEYKIQTFYNLLSSPLLKEKSNEIQYHFVTRAIDEYIPAEYLRIALDAVEDSQIKFKWSYDLQEKYEEFLARYAPFDFEEILVKIEKFQEKALKEETEKELFRKIKSEQKNTFRQQFSEIFEILTATEESLPCVGNLLQQLHLTGNDNENQFKKQSGLSKFIDKAFGVPDRTLKKLDVFKSMIEKDLARFSPFKQYKFITEALSDQECIPRNNVAEAIQILENSAAYEDWLSGFKIHLENFIETLDHRKIAAPGQTGFKIF
ncbi:MAG: hypothetical protein ACT4OY_06140 [Alphaproteobacteria bacterium]